MTSPDSSARSPSAASAKFHHRADAFAARERREAVVDLGKPDAPRDELVQLQPAAQVLVHQPWKIAVWPRVAIARAHDALLAHERSPAERDLFVHVDLAEPHHVS